MSFEIVLKIYVFDNFMIYVLLLVDLHGAPNFL